MYSQQPEKLHDLFEELVINCDVRKMKNSVASQKW